MTFRALQLMVLTGGLGYWAVRFATNPGHIHPVWLLCGALALASSEAGYRAGLAARQRDSRAERS